MTSPPVPPSLPASPLALVTGATGYIGGRLVPELLAAGFRVRVMARRPRNLADREWHDQVEIVQGDAADSVADAMGGVDVAYYLIHSLGTGADFEALDRAHARNFAIAARACQISRIVYLGGLYPEAEKLSPHLESRKEVAEILLASGVPTTALRAAVIIGSGSASFEMLRYLTERLPVMITPRWVDTRIQPIAVKDVLSYLVGSASMPPQVNRGFDIGGQDVLTYRQMMGRSHGPMGDAVSVPPQGVEPAALASMSDSLTEVYRAAHRVAGRLARSGGQRALASKPQAWLRCRRDVPTSTRTPAGLRHAAIGRHPWSTAGSTFPAGESPVDSSGRQVSRQRASPGGAPDHDRHSVVGQRASAGLLSTFLTSGWTPGGGGQQVAARRVWW